MVSLTLFFCNILLSKYNLANKFKNRKPLDTGLLYFLSALQNLDSNTIYTVKE